jgi:hypothetical protein
MWEPRRLTTLWTSRPVTGIDFYFLHLKTRDSATGRAKGLTVWSRLPQGQDSSLLHSNQTASWAHPAPCLMGAGGTIYPGFKWLGRGADYSPPSSAEVKNGGALPPLPHMSSWHSTYLIKHRDQFTHYLYFQCLKKS